MGRFFLYILALQSIDKLNFVIQEFVVGDLSLPYWEISNEIEPKSTETTVCTWLGVVKVFCDYMAQLYSFFLAILIKQIIKDPIHKLSKVIYLYHFITITVSLLLTVGLGIINNYGVEVITLCNA
jgi:hypothetical protein